MPENKIIEFSQDTKERKRWFKAASFAHPAKMHLFLQMYLIEHYTKPGDTILDPMGGSGTILVACALGRNVILVELEDKFVKMQQENWQKIQSLGPMMFCKMGKATILQGDARNLDVVADNILFSPPYAEAQEGGGISKAMRGEGNYEMTTSMPGSCYQPKEHGKTKGQIGNLPYGKADAVITSPPYSETNQMPRNNPDPTADKRGRGNIGKQYSDNSTNIGNLKSENYLQAMLQVYRQCHKVLKEKGLMVLVTKNFIRDKKVVRLDLDTIKLCEQAGFTHIDRLARKLTQQSFWRTIYHKKYPNVPKLEYEDILVFQRNEQKGL